MAIERIEDGCIVISEIVVDTSDDNIIHNSLKETKYKLDMKTGYFVEET